MVQHLVPLAHLLALAALGLAELALVLIQAVPALPCGVGDALLLEESLDGLQLRLLRVKADAVGSILQQVGDGLVGVALRVADQADSCLLYTSDAADE